MNSKIVVDSSGDLLHFDGVDFANVPLKILVDGREYVDDETVDVQEFVEFLLSYKGKATTSCPGVGEFLEAYGDAENVYCVTITSNLSGSYNAAEVAARTYLEQHPDRKVHVFDSLSAGPELALIAEKIREYVLQGLAFEDVVAKVKAYQQKTRLLFSLESLHNLANNGRVPAAVAAVAGMLGIRLIGKASDVGTLQPIGKARGAKKLIPELVKQLTEMGYKGGKLLVDHCNNPAAAEKLKETLKAEYPDADIRIGTTHALCSFYAENGGMLIGFEIA